MISMPSVQRQLIDAGFKNRFFGWSAIRQLPNIMVEDEIIEKVISGVYEAGYALVIATNRRILFLDKKPASFVVEEVAYDMVSEVEYRINPFSAHITIHC